jgi:hypothetical protein
MNQSELLGELIWWLHRIDGYLLANVIDDPAWLAFMFC